MERIELDGVIPKVFSDKERTDSDVWNKKMIYEKGKSYLVEAISGAGKSSLCSFIYGYRKDYEGTISFDGRDVKMLSRRDWTVIRRKNIGMMFQELRLFPELTSRENVTIKNNITQFRDLDRIRTWFRVLGIEDKWSEPVGMMSLGQQQRVAFVRMLCQPADFLIMDEPVSHLDDENGGIMGRILEQEMNERGVGVIVTSIGRRMEMNYDAKIKM